MLALVEDIEGGAAGGGEALGVGEAAALGLEGLVLAGLERGLVDFLDLEVEEVAAALGVAGARLKGGEAGGGVAPGAVGLAVAVELLLVGAVAVEEAELVGGREEVGVLVLGVEVDKVATELAELGEGGAAAVDVAAGGAGGEDLAANDDGLGVGGIGGVVAGVAQAGGVEPGADFLGGGLAGAVGGLDAGAVGAGAEDVGGGALAEEELEGAKEDALAGAGLAGDGGEAGSELDLEALDDGVVLDAQGFDHGRGGGGRWAGVGRRRGPRMGAPVLPLEWWVVFIAGEASSKPLGAPRKCEIVRRRARPFGKPSSTG